MNKNKLGTCGLAMLLCCAAAGAGQAPAPKVANPENPLGLRLHHITAGARNVDRAVQWYRDMLGFRLDLRGSRADGRFQFAEMSIPGCKLTFVALRDAGDRNARGGESDRGGGDRRQQAPQWERITFEVADPAVLYAELQRRGARPRTRGSGPLNSFLVDDSEGNEIEIVRINAETR